MTMTFTINPDGLVLVGMLSSPKDLEIARMLGWFRIPFQRIQKIVRVDYLAFFQSGSFPNDHKWMVGQLAEVKGVERVTRAHMLVDEPDHPRAGEECYKVHIGPLQALQHPIVAGSRKQLTNFYTTGSKLTSSKYLIELPIRNRNRTLDWKALRERAAGHSRITTSAQRN